MPRENVALQAFNRGIISPLALARTDLKRLAFSAITMVNWMSRVLGSMMLRPGLEYIGSTKADAATNCLEFIFSTDDTAIVEVTDGAIRVWVDDALVTRPSVSTSVTGGTFVDAPAVANWTDADESGGVSVFVAGGYLGLTGNGTAAAIRYRLITVAGGDQNVEHAINIVVNRGPVTLRVGSTLAGDEYINETNLGTGTHSLTITPTGDFYIQFQSRHKRQILVDSCTIESSGVMSVTSPWTAADLDYLRFDQSGDILYVTCSGYQQRKIERRSTKSWSVVTYQPEDGPFNVLNTGPITIATSALSGNVTLTASAALFRSTHVGALFRISSTGQNVTASVTAQNQFTNTIRVEGVGTSRVFTIVRSALSGTGSTVTLQRSLSSNAGPWEDVVTYTTDATISYNDSLDNQIAWYRIGVKTGNYAAGTIALTLNYAVGSIDGICRLTAVASSISASAEVFTDFGATSATTDWYEGQWSDRRGWPSAVSFAEGRLWFSGKNGIWGSVSDAFEVFDDETVGDSGPISRTIGSGPVDNINWIIALQRLLLGAEGAEFTCKSSSLDEPLTPTNFNVKPASNSGSGFVEAVVADKVGVYVQRGGTRVMQIAFDGTETEYGSSDLTLLCPEVTRAQVKRMAIQRQPDTRIHCVLADGTAAVSVYDRVENVLCWLKVETDGDIDDVCILPGYTGDSEDRVYYVVNRTGGRYIERWALESECEGATLNKQADSYVIYSGASTTTVTGLDHLEGKTVVVWGNGADLGTYTVTGGQITGISTAITDAIIGLAYTSKWESTKLAYAAGLGTALNQKHNISHLGVILQNTHHQGLKYGPDFDTLDDLPLKEDEAIVETGTIYSTLDEEAFEFPGHWDTDIRLCLQAAAPRPCTILAATISMETHDKY